jgi:hypothetical protein
LRKPYGARLFGVFALVQIGLKFPFGERRIGEFGRKAGPDRRGGANSRTHTPEQKIFKIARNVEAFGFTNRILARLRRFDPPFRVSAALTGQDPDLSQHAWSA